MEVIHDEPKLSASSLPPIQPDFNPEIQMLEKLRLEELRKRMENPQAPLHHPTPQPQSSPAEDQMTKRQAAMIFLTYLGKKKQDVLISVLGAVGVYMITAFAGWIGGILAVVVVCIWFGNQFLSNEKEIKALKTRFVI